MINLKCRTEYSFRTAYGQPEKIIEVGGVGMCDRHGTWGHVQFSKAAKKAKIKPVFGVELAVVNDADLKEKQGINYMSFLARNNAGLRNIYELTTLATEKTYYVPRLDYSCLHDITEDVIILSGTGPELGSLPRKKNMFIELSPMSEPRLFEFANQKNLRCVATSDNFFPRVDDKRIYDIVAGDNRESRNKPMHILNEWEWMELFPYAGEQPLRLAEELYKECNAVLPTAEMMHYEATKTLLQLCQEGAKIRQCDLTNKIYGDRLKRELDLIKEKKFEDYFYVISDMVQYAKNHMLVGPARGSSCGSLVCYLLFITDIDPLPHNLLFERFIDITREDLPDIDIDFQDDRREMVFEYLRQKYGTEKVARLGTVARYKAKSTIIDVSKELSIAPWEVHDLKEAIIERSGGDSRAAFCILDTFEQLDIGKKTLEKFPELKIAADIENHARQSGQHAAGVLVTAYPVTNYCSVDKRTGAAMIDKKDAEELNLLKIDALGLRTLSVLQDVLDSVGWTRDKLLAHPLDDDEAFKVIRDERFSGIFQFEGFALQNICRQMAVNEFNDIVAITALARPGPLTSGGTTEYIKKKTGQVPTTYIHPMMEKYTKDTYGSIVYQEQVMQICREIGKLSWEDVSTLRKALSKSFGKEYFDKFKERFINGAALNEIDTKTANIIWEHINTMGCLSGETEIQNPFPNHAYGRSIKLKELAENGGYIRKHAEYKKKPYKNSKDLKDDIIKKQQIYSMHEDKTIRPARCLDAFYSGEKETFEIKLEGGKSIRATTNHRFYKIYKGWTQLSMLKSGDRIAVMGEPEPTERKRKTGTGSGAHNRENHIGNFSQTKKYLKRKYKCCQNCKKAPYEETHHKNMNHKDHRLENLMPVCRKCHKFFHREISGSPVPHQKGKSVEYDKIISIANKKTEKTYDISMPLELQNFVANGIIVHNSWAFNLSHSVAYGLVSYWCMILKAKFPLEFAAACLRNSKSEDQVIQTIRELVNEGYNYKVFDKNNSTKNWAVVDGVLTGGLLNLKGCGDKMADDIIKRRDAGVPLTKRQESLMELPITPYDHIFECKEKFKDMWENPEKHNISSELTEIKDITEVIDGEYCFFGKLETKNLRDLNEAIFLQKRGGKRIEKNTDMLNLTVSDDTGSIRLMIDRFKYQLLGKPIVEEGKIGDWYLWKGTVRKGFLQVKIVKWRKL